MSRRERIRRHRVIGPAYRVVVFVIGVTVTGTGLALLVLPGPGWLMIFTGLALLATEFVWAERLLHKSKQRRSSPVTGRWRRRVGGRRGGPKRGGGATSDPVVVAASPCWLR